MTAFWLGFASGVAATFVASLAATLALLIIAHRTPYEGTAPDHHRF